MTNILQVVNTILSEHPLISLGLLLIIVGVIYGVMDKFIIPDEEINNKQKE